MSGRKPDREFIPPVQMLRVQYAKRGRLRFCSHRDFQRAFERALRRVGVPMAYSAGFSPHPKIAFAGAAPTGVASEAEYLEIGVMVEQDPAGLAVALDASLPAGLDIVRIAPALPGSLASRLQASRWRLEFEGGSEQIVADAWAAFEARSRVDVERVTKGGRRVMDVRALVCDANVAGTRVEVTVEHGDPTPRPDDVVRAVAACVEHAPVLSGATRLAQGIPTAQGLADPLTEALVDPAERAANPGVEPAGVR